jgi:DNA end-binding protein Ku
MPRAIWSGSISFGLVNIPIKLFTAIRPHQMRFHLLHEKDGVRLEQKLVCPADHKEVSREDTVRGFEISPDQMVVVEPEELQSLAPKASRTIELIDFVNLNEIDSIYFDQPYYVVPDERAAKAYRLFYEAMLKSKKVGIASFVMRNKQYLCALRPLDNVICLETMHYSDELVSRNKLEGLPTDVKVSDREVKMAEQLIESLTTGFKPQKYHDEYRDAVKDLVEQKAEGKKIVRQEAPSKKPQVIDLMSALKASLDETKKKKKSKVA